MPRILTKIVDSDICRVKYFSQHKSSTKLGDLGSNPGHNNF